MLTRSESEEEPHDGGSISLVKRSQEDRNQSDSKNDDAKDYDQRNLNNAEQDPEDNPTEIGAAGSRLIEMTRGPSANLLRKAFGRAVQGGRHHMSHGPKDHGPAEGTGNAPMQRQPQGCSVRDFIGGHAGTTRSEEHTSELQSRVDLVCRLLL